MNYKGMLPLLLVPMLIACEVEDEARLTISEQVGIEDPAMAACVDEAAQIKGWKSPRQVTAVHCMKETLMSIVGLEKFPNLRTLDIRQSAINSLDLRALPALEEIIIAENPMMTRINFSESLALTKLQIWDTPLDNLDVSNLPELQHIYINKTNIKLLNTYNSPNLSYLSAMKNRIQAVDLSDNDALTTISLEFNELSTINLESTPSLQIAVLDYNQLSSIKFAANQQLTALHLSNNALTEINLDNNPDLLRVDLKNNPLSENTKLYLNTINWIPNLEW